MSYGKRDEDAEQAIVKVDRTSVFQEGLKQQNLPHWILLIEQCSPIVQLISDFSSKMPNPPHQDRPPPLHRGKVSYERSYLPFLRHIQAFSKQRCVPTADGIFGYQGVGEYRRGRDYGHEQHNERYISW